MICSVYTPYSIYFRMVLDCSALHGSGHLSPEVPNPAALHCGSRHGIRARHDAATPGLVAQGTFVANPTGSVGGPVAYGLAEGA